MTASALTPYLPVAASVLGLAVNCIAQILSFRVFKRKSPLPSLALGFLGGLIFMGIVNIAAACAAGWNSELCIRIALIAVPAYCCLAYGYFHFVNIGEASIRLRIFDELSLHPAGVSMKALLESYNDATILEFRLNRLVTGGDLVDRGGRYYIGRRRFEWVAKPLFLLKYIILGKAGNPPQ